MNTISIIKNYYILFPPYYEIISKNFYDNNIICETDVKESLPKIGIIYSLKKFLITKIKSSKSQKLYIN